MAKTVSLDEKRTDFRDTIKAEIKRLKTELQAQRAELEAERASRAKAEQLLEEIGALAASGTRK